MKPIIPFVETMITQTCNLSCTGCTNYSDLPHKGYVTWEEGKAQLEAWLERIEISDFGIMGGEPLMNPEVREWIRGCRELMPNSQIRFITNGERLMDNLDIIDLLDEVGNVVFKITEHRVDKRTTDAIEYVMNKFEWEPVYEYGIHRLKNKNGMRFYVGKPETFLKTYRGTYHDMLPYDNNPKEAFDACCQQTCALLYKGRIGKCSTAAILPDTLSMTGNLDKPEWAPYASYLGISPDSSDEDIQKFIKNFGKPASMCRMCPTRKDSNAIVIHKDNVRVQKYKL